MLYDADLLKRMFSSMRLRTLPLAVSGTILGLLMAASDYMVKWEVALFTVLTASMLQILSNVANDPWEGRSYKIWLGWNILLPAVSGLAAIRFSFGTFLALEPILFLIFGACAIRSALRYTMGKGSYSEKGTGDFYAFLYFGIASVLGSYFLAAHEIRIWYHVLPAFSIGVFSSAVLNINNMRDIAEDELSRKTIPVRKGLFFAKIYQTVLIVSGWLSMIAYVLLRFFDPWHFLFVLSLPLFAHNLAYVWKHGGKDLDRSLPELCAAILLFALLSGIGLTVYLLVPEARG